MSAAWPLGRLRCSATICLAGLLLLTCSCDEHRRLAGQIADVRMELDTVQKAIAFAETEQSRYAKEDAELRSQQPLRLGTEMVTRKVNAFNVDIEALKRRKAELEAGLPELKADYEAYRKKYL